MHDSEKLNNEIVVAVEQLDEENVIKLAEYALEQGMKPCKRSKGF